MDRGSIAGLAQQMEHVLLVGLDAGLVEGVDALHVAGHAAGELKEVDERAERFRADLRQADLGDGHAAGDVRGLGGLHGLFVDVAHLAAGQVVEPVEILVVGRDGDGRSGVVKEDNGLLQHADAVLDILAHGVQVRRQVDGGGEDALAVLALGLAVELLPPLRHEAERGLVGGQNFNILAVRVQGLAAHGVLPRGAVYAGTERILALGLRAAHERLNVDSAAGDGQQAHSRQHGVAAADVVGHDEALIALAVGKGLERASGLVGRGVDAALRDLGAVFLFERGLEDAEGDGGLGRGAGLGDDVHGEIAVADHGEDLRHRVGGDAVAGKIDVRGGLGQGVVVGALQKLHDGARAEIAAADADDDQRLGIGLDLRRSLLDAGEFVLVVVHRQVDPADEIVARAGAVHQRVKRGLRRSRVRLSGIKLLCAFKIDAYHIDRSFSKLMQYHLFFIKTVPTSGECALRKNFNRMAFCRKYSTAAAHKFAVPYQAARTKTSVR